jgi:hypothetical protein
MTIKQAKEIVAQKLLEAIEALPADERIPVQVPTSVSEYTLNHPKAALLIIYKGGEFQKSKNGAGVILQDRDIQIGIIVVARKTEFQKQPEEYLEFIIDSLSGLETGEFTGRPDRKVTVVNDEWIDEENGIWRYGVTVNVPTEFLEVSQRG